MEFIQIEAPIPSYPECPFPPLEGTTTPIVVESCVFRMEWSHLPHYRIELCFAPKPKLWFVRRVWTLPEHGGVESRPTASLPTVFDLYSKTVKGLCAKSQYVFSDRRIMQGSPFAGRDLGTITDHVGHTAPIVPRPGAPNVPSKIRDILKRDSDGDW